MGGTVARLDSFLRLVTAQRASDLHFVAGARPTIRHNGELVALPFRALSDAEARRFLYEIIAEHQQNLLEQTRNLDFTYDLKGVGRFRGNAFFQDRGLGAVFRVIPEQVPELADHNYPAALRRIMDFHNGLVLFTGPTGCGKTTTQAALINEINATRDQHIITVEDPIEFIHQPKRSFVTQRQVGVHVDSFSSALRSALREAPDVLLVGEMRDLETISLAISAAETGVLVFGTLHTYSASSSVDRIIDSYPEEQAEQVRGVLSVALRCVVSQRLLPRADGDGRVCAMELMFNSTAIANLIRDKKTYQIDGVLDSPQSGSGNRSLDRSLYQLVRERLISVQAALGQAVTPAMLEKRIDGLGRDGATP
jgi:twitching motility protein PilT